MKKDINGLNIMHHTHWDREWYETFEEFRYKLRNGLRYIQELIDEEKIKCFFVDGQTMVIDDYKEIVSQQEFDKLKALIKAGKVEVGPWYVLADEFLVGGESLIKNLELGTNISKELGSKYDIGYLPDTFGHISQMPQVLKEYGINNAIIWRGAVSETFENNWVASDGSKVLTFVLPLFDGYFQTYMKRNDWEEKLNKYIEDNTPYCENGQVLAMNGADHTYTSSNIGERIKEFKKNNPELQIDEVLMSDYVKKFDDYVAENNIIGELRNQNKIFTLPGVFSTRMYLKQGNQRCEDNMVSILEFLNAWTDGSTKSDEFITYLWKLLVQNHAHDSICGCSIDEVHEEMEVRFKKILSAVDQFRKSTLEELYPWDYISENFVNDKLYIINNVPFKDKYVVESEVIVPKDADKGAIELSYNGEKIEFELLNRSLEEDLFRDIKVEPHYAFVYKYKVRFVMEFDGIESKKVDISLVDAVEINVEEVSNKKEIENEYYKISIDTNGFKILDKNTNNWYENQNIIISSLDAGDTYNYSPPKFDSFNIATINGVENCNKNNISQEIEVDYKLEVPKGLSEDRTKGSEERVTLNIKSKITLVSGINKILFETKINNLADNHKIRIGFNVEKCDVHYSDTAFDLVERGVLRNQNLDVNEREELECNQHPTLSTVFANELQIIHEGMQEYEVCEFNNKDYCFITAIRAVGDLSRRDLRTRGGGAGPGIATPGAQCKREHIFNYGLVIGKGKFNINNNKIIRSKVITKQSNESREVKNLVSVYDNSIAYSSLSRKDSGRVDMRVFNIEDKTKKITLKVNDNFRNAYLVRLDGTKVLDLTIENGEINIDVNSKKIVTVALER